MKDKATFLKDCVVTIMADDYENFEIILKQIRRVAALRKMKITKLEVAAALESALAGGYAEAYVLSSRARHSRKVTYSPDRLYELWFYVTPRGKRAAKGMPMLTGEQF